MKTKSIKRLFYTGFAASVIMIGSGLQGWCSNSILSAVNIEGTNNTYVVTLKTSKDIQVITRVPSSDKLIVDLSDTNAADLIKTSFKNTDNIQDVIVQPLGNDSTRLYISGQNVSKSKIIIDSTKSVSQSEKMTEEQIQTTASSASQIQNQEAGQSQSQLSSDQTGSSITSNNSNGVADTSSVEASLDKQETTGVVSAPPEDAQISDPTAQTQDDKTENSTGVLDPEVFRPSADLDVPESPAIQKHSIPQPSEEINNSNNSTNSDSLLSNSNLIRFGILFVFVTVLVAFLRKEKIFSSKPRNVRKQLNQEHLDIYRSLHSSVNKSNAAFRGTTNYKNASSASMKKDNNKLAPKQKTYNNTLRQVNALNSYKNNAIKGKTANIPTMKAKTAQTKLASSGNNSSSGNNVEFLKNMVELYEKSGRHDLAVSLQKQLRKANSK